MTQQEPAFKYGPFVIMLFQGLISGWVHEPHHRAFAVVLFLSVWTFYRWWRGHEDYKLYLYFMLAMAAFGLLYWINPLLPWWIFTGSFTIGAIILFVLLHRRAWQVMDL